MARTIPATCPLPDPARMLAGLPIVASDWQDLGRAINFLDADPGVPPIRQAWVDGQYIHSGASTLRNTYRIREWSPAHTARGLKCRVRSTAFGGAGATVTWKSVNTGNTVTVALGAAAGWYDAAALLVCSFGPGYDDVEVYCETAAGTLGITAMSCIWDRLPSPLAAGSNGGVIPIDDLEVAADRPLSHRLGRTMRASLEALAARQQVYAVWSGLEGIVTGGGIDCSYANPGWKWHYCIVHPGTRAANWQMTYHARAEANGYLDLYHGTEQDAAEQGSAPHTEVDFSAGVPPQWKSGTFRFQEIQLESHLAPLHTSDFNIVPRVADDAQVSSFVLWGR